MVKNFKMSDFDDFKVKLEDEALIQLKGGMDLHCREGSDNIEDRRPWYDRWADAIEWWWDDLDCP
jgi:hypothetical protein